MTADRRNPTMTADRSNVIPFPAANGMSPDDCQRTEAAFQRLLGEDAEITTQTTEDGARYVVGIGETLDGEVVRSVYRERLLYAMHNGNLELIAESRELGVVLENGAA